MKKVNGFKGFDKNLSCRGKQYELGKEFKEETAEACESGMHFCENPFDVLQYYPLCEGNRYAEVCGYGIISRKGHDTKVSSSELKIGVELDLKGLILSGVKFIFEKTKKSKNVTTATTGDRANAATTGEKSISASLGYMGGVSSIKGNWIICAERDKDGNILCVLSSIVDGIKLKENIVYTVKNGRWVEKEKQ